ncbi:hypothetical protein Fmac_015509 [Flemingia macrophylla]|uniref:Uncharacterized protein n=1 Tax=Flemingia macrophylla TaxID=520843 RepID=A0ABD1MEV0_9FABA
MSIHNTSSYPSTSKKTLNNYFEKESFEGWKLLKKTCHKSFSSQDSKKNGTQEAKGKNPRLSWGDGLAKFEKTKTSVSTNKESYFLSHDVLEDEVTNATGFATPSFDAFTDLDDMTCVKPANLGNNVGNLVGLRSFASQNLGDDFLDRIYVNSLTSLSSSIFELLESIDPSSSLERSIAMNKLVKLKALMTNELQVTETKIDSLEDELKSLQFEFEDMSPCLTTTCFLQVCHDARSCNQESGIYDKVTSSQLLQISTFESDKGNAQKMPLSTNLHGMDNNSNEDKINNLEIATSKFVKVMPLVTVVSSCDATCTCCKDLQVAIVSSFGDGNSSSLMDFTDVVNVNSCTKFYFGNENTSYNTIISSNQDAAKRACEAIAMLLPKYSNMNNVGFCKSSVSHIDVFIKEKFVEKQRFARFKEIVLTIKYKVFHYLWKTDLCLRSARKCLPTSHSNLE